MRLALVLLLALLAGCAEPASGAWRLSGSFTEAATQADVEEARALARARGADMVVLESFPPQFTVTGISNEETCQDLRVDLQARAYVRHAGACAQT